MLLPSQRKLTRMMLACIGYTKTENSKSKKRKKEKKEVNNYTHLLLSPLNMSSPTDILKHTHTRLIYVLPFLNSRDNFLKTNGMAEVFWAMSYKSRAYEANTETDPRSSKEKYCRSSKEKYCRQTFDLTNK